MTGMAEREKVIRGLESCITCDPDGSRECKKCPYRRKGITNEPCFNALHADALALLKEQEAKPPIINENSYGWKFYYCPSCKKEFYQNHKFRFCEKCGQEVKWDD